MMRARYAPGDYLARGAVTSRLVLAVVSALVAASTLVILTPNPDAAAAPDPVLGVYAGAAYPPAVRAFAATLGAQPQFAMDFLNGTTWRTITQTPLPVREVEGQGLHDDLGRQHAARHVHAEQRPLGRRRKLYGLTQGATGEFDHYFQTVATNIVRAGSRISDHPVGWEFNGNWFPWAAHGCASAYVRVLRRHRHHHALGAGCALHLRVEPDPRGSGRRQTWPNYYPGDSTWTMSASTSTTSSSRLPRGQSRVPAHADAGVRARLARLLRRRPRQADRPPRVGTGLGHVQRERTTDHGVEQRDLRGRQRDVGQPHGQVDRVTARGTRRPTGTTAPPERALGATIPLTAAALATHFGVPK